LIDASDSSLRPHLTVLGHQGEERIGELLVAADIGLTCYPREKFGKSGTMMACAMAGLPILATDGAGPLAFNGDAGSLVRCVGQHDLAQLRFDEPARRAEQERAAEKISWPALAARTLEILNTLVPVVEK
jgi:hypothetical protein